MMGPRIEVLIDNAEITPPLHDALLEIGARVCIRTLVEAIQSGVDRHSDARILLTSDQSSLSADQLSGFLAYFDRDPIATLVLSSSPAGFEEIVEAAEDRAIICATELSREELICRLSAMGRLREPMDQLRKELDGYRKREKDLLESMELLEQQVRTACALQRNLVATALPDIKGARIEVLFKPVDLSSGDIYSVSRLDNSHVGIALADATGHGLPAAFLSTYAKQLLGSAEFNGVGQTLLSPAEVLGRLNQAVCDSGLKDCQFLATLHALFDEDSKTICWARGGMPYPILKEEGAKPRAIPSSGPLVGIVPDADFEIFETRLKPSQRLVFYTDGVPALLMDDLATRCSCDLSQSEWFCELLDRPLDEMMHLIKHRCEQTQPEQWTPDDITMIVVEAID